MLKGRPATTVCIGFAPEPDGDGVALGTPETGDPDPEGGNTFEVGLVPDSPGDGGRGGSDGDAVGGPGEGAVGCGMGSPLVGPGPGGATDGGRLGKPLDVSPGGPFVEAVG